MERISTPTAVQKKFVDGNKLTGRKATQFSAEWCNNVQEEICHLIEASGSVVGGSDDQLKQIFTVLYVLDATFKSLALRKAFAGGASKTEIDGEKLKMSASGTSVDNDSMVDVSRIVLKYVKSVTNGKSVTEVAPGEVSVKRVDGNDNVANVLDVLSDGFRFKSGGPLQEHASVVYDPTDGTITIHGLGGIICSDALYAAYGVSGDVSSNSVSPETAGSAVTIGSVAGGVQILGRTLGFKGPVATNTVNAEDDSYPITVNAILKALNLPDDFVSVDDFGENGRDAADQSRDVEVSSLWAVKQVKRFLNTSSSNRTVWFFKDATGGNTSVVVPPGSYVTFCCVGFFTDTYTERTYAILVKGA